ncbi:trypsin-like peptidase domain-containing protein [Rhizobium leguminosarum]|uniref:nSTAND1 domain-containing NTPase n=1 Tax=Rhizobium leguminosarum TaxID=384 RepID=UPI003F967635
MTLHYTQPVACIRDEGGAIHGTGWLALGRYVVTCAHVVDDALKRKRGSVDRPDVAIKVDLPFLRKLELSARVVAWFPARPLSDLVRDPLADIAVLEIQGDGRTVGGIEPAAVDRRIPARGTGFLTYGFPAGFDNGVEASGEVLVQDPGGWLHVKDTQAFGHFIKPGFSGAPVVSHVDLRFMGMATAADRNEATRLAFLLPSHLICRAFPPLAKPYRELFAFGEEDADLFFGRTDFVTQLQAKLGRHSFAAVIGPSGSGKTSVVLAGLVPSLRQAGWNIAVCRPLRDPLLQLGFGLASLTKPDAGNFSARIREAEEWATRLREDPGRILDLARQLGRSESGQQARTLVIIDQFEELFTQDMEVSDGIVTRASTSEHGSPHQAEFLAVLEAIASLDPDSSPIQAVVTMRVDFMGHALAIRRLATLLQDTDIKLGPMTAAELSEAIRRPARTFGVEFEDGLAEELVAVMQGRTGGLPLLAFTLDRLWRRQEERMLTWAAYRGPDGKGGLETALNEHADEVLHRLGQAAEAGVRRVMLRLVRLGDDDAPDARAVARRGEIGEADWSLAQRLADGRSRLLTLGRDAVTGEETAELVHEALIGAWSRLRGWLLEDRDYGLWRQRLNENLQTWTDSSQDADLLLRGRLLHEAATWLATPGSELNDSERAFINASQDHAREEAEEELRNAHERERTAKELAEAAQDREQLANKLKKAAEEGERAATELAATRGKALAEADSATKRQRQTNLLLRSALVLMLITLMMGVYFYSVAETARLAAEAMAREAKGRQLGVEALGIQRDLSTDESIERAAALSIESWRRFPTASAYQAAVSALRDLPRYVLASDSAIIAVAVSPAGDLFASASADGSVRLNRVDDGKEVARFKYANSIDAIVFNAAGELLATTKMGADLMLLRPLRDWSVRITNSGEPTAVAFSPNGDLLGIGGRDGTRLVRTTDGTDVARFSTGKAVTGIAINSKGDVVATAIEDRSVRLVLVADQSEFVRIDLQEVVSRLAFSPLGDLLATAALGDPKVVLFDTTTGDEVHSLLVPGIAVESFAFLSGGTFLWIGDNMSNEIVVDTNDARTATQMDRRVETTAYASSRRGDFIVRGDKNGDVHVKSATDDAIVTDVPYDGPASVFADIIAFSANGDLLATVLTDGTVRLIHTLSGREITRITHGVAIHTLAFNKTADLLAIGGVDGRVRVIRIADGVEVSEFAHRSAIIQAEFGPTGDLLATASFDRIARLTRSMGGRQVARIVHDGPVSDVAFSPKGDLVATTDLTKNVRVSRTTDGVEVMRLIQTGGASTVAFSPTGDFLVVGANDATRIFRVRDGREIVHNDDSWVKEIAFSPDGELLATGSVRGKLRLIGIPNGKEITTIEGRSFEAVAFSPTGDLLAAISFNEVRLIQTSDGSEIARIKLDNAARDVAFTSLGDVVAAGRSGIRILDAPARVLTKLCTERVGRNLSAVEWRRYIGSTDKWAPTCREWASEPSLVATPEEKQSGGQNK